MPRYLYVVLSPAHEGREDEFDAWYDDQHLADVKRVPGVLNVRRFEVAFQRIYDLVAPNYRSLAMYEVETDDPERFVDGIKARSGTAAMPSTDALTKEGMIQIVALPIDGGG